MTVSLILIAILTVLMWYFSREHLSDREIEKFFKEHDDSS